MDQQNVTPDTPLSQILTDPKKHEVLARFGVPCITCPFLRIEMDVLSLKQICHMYGINLNKLLIALNNVDKDGKKGSSEEN